MGSRGSAGTLLGRAGLVADFEVDGGLVEGTGRTVVLDLLGQRVKTLFHVAPTLGTHFQIEHVVLLCHFPGLVLLDLTLALEVALGAEEDSADVLAGVALDLFDPAADAFEALLAIDRVGEDDARGSLVIGLRDVAEPLLPSRVPDLQLHLRVVDMDRLQFEVDSNGRNIAVFEHPITELGQQVRLAYPTVPNDDNLRQEVMLARFVRHCSII